MLKIPGRQLTTMKSTRIGNAVPSAPDPTDGAQLLTATDALPPRSNDNDHHVMLPADPAAQRQAVRDTMTTVVGAHVFSSQMHGLVSEEGGKLALKTAELFIESIRESVQPRDAIEEMLAVQMAWTHARLAKLSSIASQQERTNNVRVINDACDRAAATFRRQMLALAEYRRPRKAGNFVAIKQANVANQQLIANAQDQNPRN